MLPFLGRNLEEIIRLVFSAGLFFLTAYITRLFDIYVRRLVWSRKLGCKDPKRFPFWEGLNLFLNVRKRFQRHTVIPGQSDLHKIHGNTFEVAGPLQTTLFSIDPQNIRAIWATNFSKWGIENPRLAVLGDFCGRGLATVDGEEWRRTREEIRPHFYGSSAPKVDLVLFEEHLLRVFDAIPNDGSFVDLQPLIFDMYFDTSFIFLIGQVPQSIPGYEDVSTRTIRTNMDYGIMGSRIRYVQGPMKILNSDPKWMTACEFMRNFSDAVAHEGYKMLQALNNRRRSPNYEPKDDEEAKLLIFKFLGRFDNKKDLRNTLLQYFMGATPTVGGLLTNATYLLSRNPQTWIKLQKEVSSHPGPVTIESLKKFTYAKKVFDETLRLHPLTTFEARSALNDTILPKGGGPDGSSPVIALKGTMVRVNIWSLHRNPAVFGRDAENFNPDRWDFIHPRRWEYIPFGGGPRICIGQHKATTESVYAIIRFAQMYSRLEGQDGNSRSGQGAQQSNIKAIRKS